MHEVHDNIELGKKILEENDHIASHNREKFAEKKLYVVNLMGSPGSGKTSLLEKTIAALKDRKIGIIEGDLEGDDDRRRVEAAGAAQSVQINTAGACHLLATQVGHAFEHIEDGTIDLLFIENVGNLVCPADFDLGENAKVAVIGVTEGADKPTKYPLMFRKAEVLILNKMDILEQSGCSIEALKENIRKVNPEATVIELSSRTGEGVDKWLDWLQERA